MSDPFQELVDDIDQGVREGRLRVVFWLCPKGCQGIVDWSKTPEGLSVPRCRECGEVGRPR